jgi:hypothetical protein
MDAADMESVFSELATRGIELRADRGRLRYRPKDKMTPELLEALRAHKVSLLAALETERADRFEPFVNEHGFIGFRARDCDLREVACGVSVYAFETAIEWGRRWNELLKQKAGMSDS